MMKVTGGASTHGVSSMALTALFMWEADARQSSGCIDDLGQYEDAGVALSVSVGTFGNGTAWP